MTVIQTGSIALLAFVFGDYASQLFRLGDYSPSLYAALAVAILTGLNIIGPARKVGTDLVTAAEVLGLLVAVVGLCFYLELHPTVPAEPTTQSFGVGDDFCCCLTAGTKRLISRQSYAT